MTNSWQLQSYRAHTALSLPRLHKDSGSQQALPFSAESVTDQRFDDDSLVRATITETIRSCPKSRDQIADEMSVLLDKRVTTQMLNDFTSDAKKFNRWPAAWDRAFCRATGDDSLLICRVLRAGLFVIDETEAQLLELGREFLKQKRSSQKVELLEKHLSGIEL